MPKGGRTGLVGGAVSRPGEIVIASDGLATIEEVDPLERVAVIGAGVSLGALQEAAARHGLEPGIDLAARGTATIGGMISTNAGGILAFRNGVMRHRVLGLEAVLPDGRVFSDMTRVVKTSAGYDLKHLFIGAEGTLGIITRGRPQARHGIRRSRLGPLGRKPPCLFPALLLRLDWVYMS